MANWLGERFEMGTTKAEIRSWLDRGKEMGATHMIVACDTFDWEGYPVFVKPDEKVEQIEDRYDRKNMQKVMEVYNLSMDWDQQLNQARAFNR